MASDQEIVITGLGILSPIGIGKEAFWQSLVDGQSGVSHREMFRGETFPFAIAAEVKGFNGKEYVDRKARKSLKMMCREIQMAYAAAKLAMDDASLAVGEIDPDRLGCVLGSELFYTEVGDLEQVYRSTIEDGKFDFDKWGDCAMRDVFPLWMLKYLPNMPACHIGIAYDARGPNNTIVSDDCSSLSAISEASHMLRRGSADVMITGGVGSKTNLAAMAFKRDLEMSNRIDEPERASRPFDADRDGLVGGEGSCLYVLETRRHAEARGATILARIVGHGQSFGLDTDDELGVAAKGSIKAALRSADLQPSDIGHVNAHGRSTVRSDRTEASAIRGTLGDVPVVAPKSYFGALASGGGAVEMAVSVLALQNDLIPVTLNYETPDPECPINVVHKEPQPLRTPFAITLSQGEMGQANAIVLAAEN